MLANVIKLDLIIIICCRILYFFAYNVLRENDFRRGKNTPKRINYTFSLIIFKLQEVCICQWYIKVYYDHSALCFVCMTSFI